VYPEGRITAWTSDPNPVEINHAAAASFATLLVKALASSLNRPVFSAFASASVKNHLLSSPSLMS